MPRVSKKQKQQEQEHQSQNTVLIETETAVPQSNISNVETTTQNKRNRRSKNDKCQNIFVEQETQPETQPEVVVVCNTDSNQTSINNDKNIFTGYKFQPQLKNVENMERIKSKIEMFDVNKHKILLPAILITYGDNINKINKSNTTNIVDNKTQNHESSSASASSSAWDIGEDNQITHEHIIEEFKKQITQNQNGIFLNLTCCSDELWQACVQCVEQIELQYNNIEKLDKERQNEMKRLRVVPQDDNTNDSDN